MTPIGPVDTLSQSPIKKSEPSAISVRVSVGCVNETGRIYESLLTSRDAPLASRSRIVVSSSQDCSYAKRGTQVPLHASSSMSHSRMLARNGGLIRGGRNATKQRRPLESGVSFARAADHPGRHALSMLIDLQAIMSTTQGLQLLLSTRYTPPHQPSSSQREVG